MTPNQHTTEAEALLAGATAGTDSFAPPHITELRLLTAHAHALLGAAAGTGDHYAAAEAALAAPTATELRGAVGANQIRVAIAHAMLAEKA